MGGRRFYEFTGGPAWEVLVRNAGHFQFLDDQSALQRAICAVGPVADARVRAVAQARHPSDASLAAWLHGHALHVVAQAPVGVLMLRTFIVMCVSVIYIPYHSSQGPGALRSAFFQKAPRNRHSHSLIFML